MKNTIQNYFIIVATFLFIGCAPQGIRVSTDQRVNISDFNSYNWVSDIDEIPGDMVIVGSEGVLIFNNKSAHKTIKDAIQTQLEARGFERESDNPDMLVNFKVFERDAQLRTFVRQDGFSYIGDGPFGQNARMVDVERGTVLLNFLDAESGEHIWQGFASGALEDADVKDEKTLNAKVRAIFEDFNFSEFETLGNRPI